LPALLRDRQNDHHLALFRDTGDPLYAARIWGKGAVAPLRGDLQCYSSPDDPRTLIVIDNDLRLRWFDFEIEMQRVIDATKPRADPDTNRLGVFFGYRRDANDRDRDFPFFVLELQEQPPGGDTPSRLLAGWAYLEPPRGPRVGVDTWGAPLPNGKGSVDLPKAPRNRARTIRVAALDGEVRITVTGQGAETAVLAFKVDDLTRSDRQSPLVRELDPRGALGIWVDNGTGVFRNPAVTLRSKRVGE
jgi:hypothetical protein